MAKIEQAKQLPVRPDAVITLNEREAKLFRQFNGELLYSECHKTLENIPEDVDETYKLIAEIGSALERLGY